MKVKIKSFMFIALINLLKFSFCIIKTFFKELFKINKLIANKKERYIYLICTFITLLFFTFKMDINIKYAWLYLFTYFIIKSFLIEIKAIYDGITYNKKINKLNKKYKNLLNRFDNNISIIEASKKKIVIFTSLLTLNDFEKNKQILESFFNKKISFISRNNNNFRIFNIYFENTTEFKKYYRFDEYICFININKIKKMELPMILGIKSGNNFFYADLAAIKYLFVAGEAGGGKSILLNVIIQSLMIFAKKTLFLLIDLKEGVEFSDYNNFENSIVISNREEFSKMLIILEKIMIERLKLIKGTPACKNIQAYNAKDYTENLNYIVFIVDEMAEIKLSNEKSGMSEDEQRLLRILQKGRAAGIYGIGATQRPAVEQIDGNVRAGFHKSISFAISRPETQKMTKIPGTKNLKVGEFKTDIKNDNSIVYKSFLILEEDDHVKKLPECNGVYKSLVHKQVNKKDFIFVKPKKIKKPKGFVNIYKHMLQTKLNKSYDNILLPFVSYDNHIKSIEPCVITEIESFKQQLGIEKKSKDDDILLHGDNGNNSESNYEKLKNYIEENGFIPGPAETKKDIGLTPKQRTTTLIKLCNDGYIIKASKTRYKIN